MKENHQITAHARVALKGRWSLAVGTTLVFLILAGVISSLPPLSLIIYPPIYCGYLLFGLNLLRGKSSSPSQLFSRFDAIVNTILVNLLIMIFVLLWMLLLIVPGIIAAISYSQAFFIIADEPETSPMEAIRKSKEMMHGHKLQFFTLCLRFIGWAIICVLTLGIGFLWLAPYITVSFAEFYDEVRGGRKEDETMSEETNTVVI